MHFSDDKYSESKENYRFLTFIPQNSDGFHRQSLLLFIPTTDQCSDLWTIFFTDVFSISKAFFGCNFQISLFTHTLNLSLEQQTDSYIDKEQRWQD